MTLSQEQYALPATDAGYKAYVKMSNREEQTHGEEALLYDSGLFEALRRPLPLLKGVIDHCEGRGVTKAEFEDIKRKLMVLVA